MNELFEFPVSKGTRSKVSRNFGAARALVSVLLRRVFACAAFLIALPAAADTYVGVKAGMVMVDVPDDKNPMNLALYLGYRLDTQLADLSLVGEVNRTLQEGETRSGDDLEFEYDAIYLRWKTPRSLFVSVRGGIARDKIITNGNARRDDGLLVGISFGGSVGKAQIQLEYTRIADDGDFIGLSVEFW